MGGSLQWLAFASRVPGSDAEMHDQLSHSEYAEELFAEFLARYERDRTVSFEAFVAEHLIAADALRQLHVEWRPIEEASAAPAPIAIDLGYALRGELGSGTFGTVYRAWDRGLEREVALKVLRTSRVSVEGVARFVAEARSLARVRHPNVVRINGIDIHEGDVRLNLELIDGRTLQDIVECDGPLSSVEAAQVGIQLCRALAAIHAAGLVHMDVKPGNVMRERGGGVVLLDFGLARPERATNDDVPLGGSPPFTAPEVFDGRTIGSRADLFSLGVTLYWLVAGQSPYRAETLSALIQEIRVNGARPLVDVRPDVSAELAEVISRAMEPVETERFESAGAMEEALRAATDVGRRRPACERLRGRVAAPLVAIAIVLLTSIVWFMHARVGGAPTVQARLVRFVGGARVPLEDGDSIAVGDRVRLEVRVDRPVYVYLFNEDDRGISWRLLPDEDATRLAPGDWVGFPSGGADGYWESDTTASEERFFLIAAEERLPAADALARHVPRPSPGARVVVVSSLSRSAARELAEALPRGEDRGFGIEVRADEESLAPDGIRSYLDSVRRRLGSGNPVHFQTWTLRH